MVTVMRDADSAWRVAGYFINRHGYDPNDTTGKKNSGINTAEIRSAHHPPQAQYDALLGRIGRISIRPKACSKIATGTGVVALVIARQGGLVRACDISGEMIRIARDKLRASGLDNVVELTCRTPTI